MTHIVQFQNNEQLTLDDLNDIGLSTRETFDYLIGDAVDNTLKFSGFPISQTSATALTVGAGRHYQGGIMYSNEDANGVSLSLLTYLPAVAGNTKIVSIISYGTQADTNDVPRTFLTNSATGVTEANNVSTQNQRYANIATVQGVEAPNPQPPALNANYCEIARVTLNSTGIVSFKFVEANRLQSVTSLDARETALETWKNQTGARLDTLGSDISNLANAIQGLPNPAIFLQIVNTLSQVQAKAKVPSTALNFHFDYLLSQADSASDNTVASYLARVNEGIRFPWAAQAYGILQLLNPLDATVKAGSGTGLMLPDYDETARIDTMGNDGNLSLSQYQFQNITTQQQSISRQVVNFGPTETICTNSLFWQTGTYDPVTGIFSRNGETYQVTYTGQSYVGSSMKHEEVRLTEFWTSTMTDTYTTYNVQNLTVNGSTKSQTFQNSQAGWLTSVDLAFSQVAATGDVTLMVTKTSNGAPDFSQVISQVTVAAANLKTWPSTTNFPLKPTFLDAGGRYAFVIVTPGNHFVCYVANNKYAQGSMFDSTDGVFSQGDLTKDIAFRANFAKFKSTIATVEMQPLQLQNGMTRIKLLYGSKVPDGCELNWEIQVNGVWYPLQSYSSGNGAASTNPLLGLPPLCRLRVTYVGTTDLMPGIDMTQTETNIGRPGAAFQHWTPLINIGASSSNIRVEVTVDAFDPNSHTVAATLMVNGATVTASSVSTANDPNGSPVRFIKTFTFALGSPTNAIRIGVNGTTNAVTKCFHVESRFDYES